MHYRTDICETEADSRASSASLSILIPLRVDHETTYLIDRLKNAAAAVDEGLTVLVVDDGSAKPYADQIRRRCDTLGYRLIRLETGHLPFSIGRSRNVAVLSADSRYVLFQDADLVPCQHFYERTIEEIRAQGLHEATEDFLMFGCIYLTDEGTRTFRTLSTDTRDAIVMEWLIKTDPCIEKYSTGTSITLFNRLHFMALGGNDEDFEGWGFEDIEFNLRAMRAAKTFPLPDRFMADRGSISDHRAYKGWKSMYRLYGDRTFVKGIFMVHESHPIRDESNYRESRLNNENTFKTKLSARRKTENWPASLTDKRTSYLVFRDNAFTNQRIFQPLLGHRIQKHENDFDTPDELLGWCREHNVTTILFFNPYATERMIEFYQACRKQNFPYIVAERGALPDSTFYDPNGFLFDSSSYAPLNWDRPLSDNERRQVLSYIAQHRADDSSLEDQPNRVGANVLRNRLGIPEGKKILFVPLQRKMDTVTRFFVGEIESYENFLSLIEKTVQRLSEEWCVVVKSHPLEDWRPDSCSIFHAHDCNIRDLLDLCDSVLTFNSGVGLIATMWGTKNVLCAGDSFYAHSGIASHTPNFDKVREALDEPNIDIERRVRFLNYLIHHFYSFGRMSTAPTRMADGSRITATTNISYRVLTGLSEKPIRFKARSEPEINELSILFDRYRKFSGGYFRRKTRQDDRIPRMERCWRELKKIGEIATGKRSIVPRSLRR